MAKTLPVNVIQLNIYEQLQSSRRIFEQIRTLADIAELEKDVELRTKLEGVMHKLLEIGQNLSDKAAATGNEVFETVRDR